MRERSRKEGGMPRALTTMAGVLAAFLILAAGYVLYQVGKILFPQNVYETALAVTVSDTLNADGVLLFNESYVAGSGTLGYLVEDGERVSAGTAVAEIYSDASQAVLRQQLTQLNEQIDLLQKSQNTTSLQLDNLLRDRSGALYNMMDALDAQDYGDVDADARDYLLAQNKLWIVTGDAAGFTDQIAALVQQAQSVQAQLGTPTQITAPQTGYFVRASSSGRLNAGADDILAQDASQLKAYLESSPELALDGCAGKIVSGFTWRYVGVCSAEEGAKLLNLARFMLTCNTINGDVLCLNRASAQISLGENTGLRIRASAVHYLKEDGTESEDGTPDQGENYVPGVYVKRGNIAYFCKIDPVDADHPLVTDGDYILVLPKGTKDSISEVKLYDEIIVSGQNLYNGKLL